MNKRVLGEFGEKAARQFLLNNGYKIIDFNYRNKYGEIDIIAEQNDSIVFIEVKTRSSNRYGFPCEAVDYRKQDKIKKVALGYLNERCIKRKFIRFDVVEVYIERTGENISKINIIKDAF
ncbi:YraN family protein [Thermobrachium celere]|uniref:UPF0102 protein TCEL_01842 n=1 Tax=Thermobrachium celere DSM 8682 TaxID=941824 RepID=R7RRL5_9CLOT|nr:YraN family protein [Thermobrachium celere]GFR35844.1 UPF0102 protein [Thermobrachium celere]CDF57928.1 Endonuclease [Thermobrachium celere DSM 8682]